MTKKIAFISYENINSGLFESQILYPVIALAKSNPGINYEIVIFWRPRERSSIQALEVKLQAIGNIRIVTCGIRLPIKYIGSLLFSVLLMTYMQICLRRYCKIHKPDICYCRGYLTAYGAVGAPCPKFIFDPRSLWQLECVSANLLKQGSFAFHYWTKIEKKIVEAASSIFTVSTAMSAHFEAFKTGKAIYQIPILTTPVSDKNKIKQQIIGDATNLTAAYVGSLGINGINKEALHHLVNKLCDLGIRRFLFLTHETTENIASLFDKKLETYDVTIVACQANEIATRLQDADFGFHALPHQLDAQTRLGTKVLEYWNAGLPALISSHVGAAAKLIEDDNFLGYFYEDIDTIDLEHICNLSNGSRQKIMNYHATYFGYDNWLNAIKKTS